MHGVWQWTVCSAVSRPPIQQSASIAVSYTHLDVYKRQAYHRTPEMHLREGSLVADRGRHNIGYRKDITPYGATFQPLDLKGYQKEKALLYVRCV